MAAFKEDMQLFSQNSNPSPIKSRSSLLQFTFAFLVEGEFSKEYEVLSMSDVPKQTKKNIIDALFIGPRASQ